MKKLFFNQLHSESVLTVSFFIPGQGTVGKLSFERKKQKLLINAGWGYSSTYHVYPGILFDAKSKFTESELEFRLVKHQFHV